MFQNSFVLRGTGGKKVDLYKYKMKNSEDSEVRYAPDMSLPSGDWLTAQNAMLSIVVDSNFTQIMHDEVLNYINNYIINNY